MAVARSKRGTEPGSPDLHHERRIVGFVRNGLRLAAHFSIAAEASEEACSQAEAVTRRHRRRWHRHAAPVVAVAAAGALVAGSALSKPSVSSPSVSTAPSVCHALLGGVLPDPSCTPGAVNPNVTQSNISSTVCKRGWTSTIRPPLSVTEPQKFKSMTAYGISTAKGQAGLYEYDHLISLELGGAPDGPLNLWPEPHSVLVNGQQEGSFIKDSAENRLRSEVCAGKITLVQAQEAISTVTIPLRGVV